MAAWREARSMRHHAVVLASLVSPSKGVVPGSISPTQPSSPVMLAISNHRFGALPRFVFFVRDIGTPSAQDRRGPASASSEIGVRSSIDYARESQLLYS